MGFTSHAERSPQPRSQLPCVAVPQLHATNADNLADETDFLPFQVFASKILEITISLNYYGEPWFNPSPIEKDVKMDQESVLRPAKIF